MKRTVLVGLVSLAAFGALPALAHPLGNFTISHHVGLHIQPDRLDLTLAFDFAEIPAFQILRELSPNASPTDSRLHEAGATICSDSNADFEIATGGEKITFTVVETVTELRPGEGDLDTMLVTCRLDAPTPTSYPLDLSIDDRAFEDRIGWREIVVTSTGVAIESDALTTSPTSVLTSYPTDVAVRDDRSATVRLIGEGDGTSVTTPDVAETISTAAAPDEAGFLDRVGGVLAAERLSSTPLALAVLAALGLGFAHALAPGHGKTLVAAYLVGNQGNWRHAVGLGLTVAVSHTIGVGVLGAVTLAASSTFEPAVIYPYLAAASGLIVFGMGVVLVVRALQARRRAVTAQHHQHGDNDDHGHHHGGGHGHGHSHAIPTSITWRGLAALGISGGLVPSASAVILLLGAISLGRTAFGLVLVLLFGLGMSAALVGAGLMVVGAERVGSSIIADRPVLVTIRRWLPLAMALVVLGVGLFLLANASLGLVL